MAQKRYSPVGVSSATGVAMMRAAAAGAAMQSRLVKAQPKGANNFKFFIIYF